MSIQATAFPVFKPAMRIVSDITQDFPALVTTTFNHLYIDGIVLRLIVPPGYGMVEANGLFGVILVQSPTTFTIDIETTYFNPFTIPVTSPYDLQYAQCVPFGEINSTLLAAYQNVLPYSAV